MSQVYETSEVTVPWVRASKKNLKLTMLTAYDFPMASLIDEAGIDLILVGDSVGTVIYGKPNTLSVTVEDILRHTQAVSPAVKRAMVIADLPYLSYQVSIEKAIENAGRFLKETSAKAVKLEGGLEVAETVKAFTRAGIPVQAHIGLMPQSLNIEGKYRMHGKTPEERAYLLESAKVLAAAGAFSIVLECVEYAVAKEITDAISIPTIGIGSGPDCDGQVLVTHDLLGLTSGKVPKFVKQKLNLREQITGALKEYKKEVTDGSFSRN